MKVASIQATQAGMFQPSLVAAYQLAVEHELIALPTLCSRQSFTQKPGSCNRPVKA